MKVFQSNGLSFFSILLISLPVYFFGINDVEVYRVGFFSNQIINKDFFDPYIFFTDLVGPGVNFPLGNFPYFHPVSILFSKNISLFYLFSSLVNLSMQIIYFNKILKILGLKKKEIFFSFLIIFSISNFNYLWSDDWIVVFYTFTFFYPIFYYYLRSVETNEIKNFLKLGFFFGFAFINSHAGLFFHFFLFLSVFFILNDFKKLYLEKGFYISCVIAIIIMLPNLYFLLTEYLSFGEESKRVIQAQYSYKHYLGIFFLPLNFSDGFRLNRYPGIGIIIFVSLVFSIKTLLFRESKKYKYLDLIFLLFIILSTTKFLNKIPIVSGIWQIRDIITILSFIIFFFFLKENKNLKIKKIILIVNIFMVILFYVGNFNKYFINKKSEKNIIINNFISDDLKKFMNFKKENGKEEIKSKLYLSPEVFSNLNEQKFSSEGLFATTDFIKMNYYPFQGDFKNISLDQIQNSKKLMRGYLVPNFKEINNEIFLTLFQIEYILIYEDEIKNLDENIHFTIINKKKFKEKELVLLKYDLSDKYIKINKNNLEKIVCENLQFIDCIIKFENLFVKDKGLILKKEENKYIYNFYLSSEEILLTNFLYNKNWKVKNGSIISIDNRLIGIENLNNTTLFYDDKIRKYLITISIILIAVLIIYFIFDKINFLKKKSVFRKN